MAIYDDMRYAQAHKQQQEQLERERLWRLNSEALDIQKEMNAIKTEIQALKALVEKLYANQ